MGEEYTFKELVKSGLSELFLIAMLDEGEKRYPNRLQRQAFIMGCATAVGYYSREIGGKPEAQGKEAGE